MIDDDEAWQDEGFDDGVRDGFRAWKVGLDDAKRWRAVGVFDALSAVRWQLAKVTPKESSAWRTAGFDSVEALQWRQLGHSLASARAAKQKGREPHPRDEGLMTSSSGRGGPPIFAAHVASMAKSPLGEHFSAFLEKIDVRTHHLVMTYAQAGWVSDDALPWVKAGVEPAEARLWELLKVRADEATAAKAAGTTALDATREWWSAGVPLDQVGTWLGAGFTAQEAAEQIAAGVDAEQAAVLRALRDQSDE